MPAGEHCVRCAAPGGRDGVPPCRTEYPPAKGGRPPFHPPPRGDEHNPPDGVSPGRPACRARVNLLTRQGHSTTHRYWPVLATVSMDRPASVPCLPETRVRM